MVTGGTIIWSEDGGRARPGHRIVSPSTAPPRICVPSGGSIMRRRAEVRARRPGHRTKIQYVDLAINGGRVVGVGYARMPRGGWTGTVGMVLVLQTIGPGFTTRSRRYGRRSHRNGKQVLTATEMRAQEAETRAQEEHRRGLPWKRVCGLGAQLQRQQGDR